MYLSKHFIFSNLDFIFPLELFKYILSLGYLLISRKFASIICDIWGNPLDVEGTQFPPCSSSFFQVHFCRWVWKRSVQFSRSVVSDSFWPHESQHARPPCPSPSPGVHSDSSPSSPNRREELSCVRGRGRSEGAGSVSCKDTHSPLWLHERREMYKKAKVSLCCYEKELSRYWQVP